MCFGDSGGRGSVGHRSVKLGPSSVALGVQEPVTLEELGYYPARDARLPDPTNGNDPLIQYYTINQGETGDNGSYIAKLGANVAKGLVCG
jgi:hypothetical protein